MLWKKLPGVDLPEIEMITRQEYKIHDDSTQPWQENKKHDQMKGPGNTLDQKNRLPIGTASDD